MNTTRSLLAALALLVLGCASASAQIVIGGGDACRGDPTCITVTTVDDPGGHGSLSPAFQKIPLGNGAAIQVTPAIGYHVLSVTGDTCSATAVGGGVYHTGGLTADCVLTAGFIIYNYTVTASAGPNGSITPATQVIDYGNTASFTVTPDAGYQVAAVAGDTCTPVHGAGTTWTASNITAWCDVSATFAGNPHRVGGSVSGLAAGNSVVLQDNGGDDLSVAANGAFQFASTVGVGATYSVTVLTQPSTPAQTCIVSNESGSMADADVVNVQVVCSTDMHTVFGQVASGQGTIDPSSQQVADDSTAVLTVTPATGWHTVNAAGCGGSLNGTSYTTGLIVADCAVAASFAIDSFTLTYSAGANGSITGSSPQSVDYGAAGSPVAATPNTGYHFTQWSDGSTANPRTDNNVQANLAVSANFAIDSFTLTYSAGANGSITGASPQSVDYGASGTPVTATPATGYHFTQWSDGATANPRTDSNVQADITVMASFAIDSFTLTYSAGSNGSITGARSQIVSYGASGTPVTATPATGYHFTQWSDGSTANPRNDSNVQADLSVTASFAIDSFTLTYSASAHGSITGSSPQSVEYGAAGTPVTATPNTGYHFTQWSDGSTANPRTDNNVQADLAVTASFAIDSFTLTYSAGAHGSITGSSPQSVEYGAAGTPVTAVADTGYHFTQWSDGSTANPRTDSNVQADLSVTAGFAIDSFTLTYSAGTHGSITGSSPQSVDYGADGTPVTAAADTGYHFTQWSDGATANPRTDSNVQADITVTASFAIDSFTLTYSASANGSITGASPQSVDYGASGTPVTATPATGYHFTQWSDGSTANPRTDSNVQADLSVSASFTINTHHVGGSVSGLASGNVVVLQNNGGDDLSVAANGTFQFAITVDVGATYSVTVLTQPSTPEQSCTVSNGSATMADADVTNVQIDCVTLTPNLSLSVDDGGEYAHYGEVRDYQITLSNSGDGTASDVTVHTSSAASFTGVYDTSAASWSCTGTDGGATCTSSGSGLFSDTANLPPASSVTWVASMPILVNGVTPYANYTVSSTDVATAGDQDTLVICRDGFELPSGCMRTLGTSSMAAEVLHGNTEVVAVVPGTSHDGVATLRALRDAADSVSLQHLLSADHRFVRLLACGSDGQQRATPWAPVRVGARVVLGSVAAGDGQRLLLLEGAARSLTLSLPPDASSPATP